jgi:hypothetical protein
MASSKLFCPTCTLLISYIDHRPTLGSSILSYYSTLDMKIMSINPSGYKVPQHDTGGQASGSGDQHDGKL